MSTKPLIVLLALLAVAPALHAKKLWGTILTEKDTVVVLLDVPMWPTYGLINFHKLEKGVSTATKKKDQQTFTPYNTREVHIHHNDVWVKLESVEVHSSNPDAASERFFYHRKHEGAITMYINYTIKEANAERLRYLQSEAGTEKERKDAALKVMTQHGYVAPFLAREYLLRKGNGPLIAPNLVGYTETVRPLFEDCPMLKQKLDGGEASPKLTDWMVKHYNSNCSPQTD